MEIRWKRGDRQDCGKDVCMILGFQDIDKTPQRQVKRKHTNAISNHWYCGPRRRPQQRQYICSAEPAGDLHQGI